MDSNWKNSSIIVVIGLISSLIAIFVFFTGKDDINEVISGDKNTAKTTEKYEQSPTVSELKVRAENAIENENLVEYAELYKQAANKGDADAQFTVALTPIFTAG